MNRPEQSAAACARGGGSAYARMQRTGDLVRWLSECRGGADRGYDGRRSTYSEYKCRGRGRWRGSSAGAAGAEAGAEEAAGAAGAAGVGEAAGAAGAADASAEQKGEGEGV